jgi:hypothetical protein
MRKLFVEVGHDKRVSVWRLEKRVPGGWGSEVAKWFPELLAQMANTCITGQEAVTQLGAMLQVQIKSAGSADEAENNLKNWLAKCSTISTATW